jgi:hypothetical protein
MLLLVFYKHFALYVSPDKQGVELSNASIISSTSMALVNLVDNLEIVTVD